MLVIGSRAIRHHFPDFRPPLDWDLVGTDDDIARLERSLERSSLFPARREKAVFLYGDVMVEVWNASALPYWATVDATFADAPTIEDPVLGRLRVPHPGFLLLTKQCGLIYRIVHWHKNLEDLYFLFDRVPTMPENVAALLPLTLQDAGRMFTDNHARTAPEAEPCHPAVRHPKDPVLHRELHERLALGNAPAVVEPRAWEGFPEQPATSRRERMIDLFAEEAMVLAGEQHITMPEDPSHPHPGGELGRWALRSLLTSSMPDNLRYFGVNHYREIAARIPSGWLRKIEDLERLRPNCGTTPLDGGHGSTLRR
jgi:hypothetical protein